MRKKRNLSDAKHNLPLNMALTGEESCSCKLQNNHLDLEMSNMPAPCKTVLKNLLFTFVGLFALSRE